MPTYDDASLLAASEDAYQAGTGFDPASILYYPAAVVTDIFTSIANSFTIGEENELSTEDLLGKLAGRDAAEFYSQHRGAVEVGSFIGGVMVPGKLVASVAKLSKSGKLMGLNVRGIHEASYFNNRMAGQATKATEALRTAGAASAEYKAALKSMNLWKYAAGAAEATVMEAEVIALYNGHAWMDDYGADDFLLGAGIGAGLGVGIKTLTQNSRFRKLIQEEQATILQPAVAHLAQNINLGNQGLNIGAQARKYQLQVEALADGSMQPEVRSLIEASQLKTQLKIKGGLKELLSQELLGLSEEVARKDEPLVDFMSGGSSPLATLGQMVAKDPGALIGVGFATKGKSRAAISQYTKASLLGPDLEYETGLRILDSGAVEADNAHGFLFREGATLETPEALAALKDKLGDTAPSITYRDGQLVVEGFDATSNAHNLLMRTAIKNAPRGTSLKLEGSGLERIQKLIVAQRKDPGTLSLLNDQIDSKAHTLTSLREEFGFVFGRPRAVVDNWFGQPKMLDDREARLLVGAANSPGWSPDSSYLISNKVRTWNPQAQSVLQADSEMLNALNALDRLSGDQTTFDLARGDLPRLQALYVRNREAIIRFGDGSSLTTREALKEEILKVKMEEGQLALKAGLSAEQVAKSTSTPLPTIELFIETGFKWRSDLVNMLDTDFLVYGKAGQAGLKAALRPKMLLMEGDDVFKAQQDELRQTLQLDSDYLDTAHSAMTDSIVRRKAPEDFTQLYDEVLSTPEMYHLSDTLEQLVTTESFKGRLTSSADFSFRNVPLGELITYAAARFRSITNERFKEMAGTTVHPAFIQLSTNAAERSQFYMLTQAMDAAGSKEAGKLLKTTIVEGTETTKAIYKVQTQAATKTEPAQYLKYLGSEVDIEWKSGTLLDGAVNAMDTMGSHLLSQINVNRALQGMEPLEGRGLYAPYASIDEQFTAYVISTDRFTTPDIKIILGRDLADFESRLAAAQASIDPSTHRILRSRDQLQDWNDVHSLAKLEQLERYNPSKTKSGVVATQIPTDNSVLTQMLSSYHENYMSNARLFAQRVRPDVFGKLEAAQVAQEAAAGSIKPTLFSKAQKRPNLARSVANTILNRSDIPDSPWFNTVNNAFSLAYTRASRAVTAAFKEAVQVGRAESIQLGKFTAIQKNFKAQGIPMPWKDFVDYASAKVPAFADLSQEHIAKANSILVTLNLRLADLSHTAVTVMSAPLMMAAELNVAKGAGPFYPAKYMWRGIKMLTSQLPEDKVALAEAKLYGHTQRQTAEVATLFEDLHINMPKWGKVEDNKIFKMMVKPSDWSEEWTRSWAYATGYQLAKDQAPGASRGAWEASALLFTQRSMGNYLSRQRPTMFQGSFGAAIGLYQTFMLTMTQNIFRYIEANDRKALLTLAAGWQGMFGIQSLPLYQPLNQFIGRAAEVPGNDIDQAIYQQFGDVSDQSRSAAEYLLYGAPSALFQVPIQTRAALEPRLPLSAQEGGVAFQPVLVNAAAQAIQATWRTGKELAQIGGAGGTIRDMGRAIGEGISSQYLWRPGARAAELLLGRSTDATGSTVATPAEVYEPWAILSRVAGSRPLKEQALRNLRYSARYYDAIGKEARRETIGALRSMVVDGTSGEQVGSLFQKYMAKGGTVRGFNQAVQQAYMSLDKPFADKLAEDIDKDSPILQIIRTYSY